MIRKALATIVLLTACLHFLFAQEGLFTISGYISDKNSGEPLIGVAVIDRVSGQGTVTGNSGYYSITLNEGPVRLDVLYLGYGEEQINIDLRYNAKLNISLSESSDYLSEAVVTSSVGEIGVMGTQMSAVEVPVRQIKAIPAIGGEVDVIKALQLLPGVQSGGEASAGLYVRGGGADENLILMDGVQLYNVSHLMGFLSAFNADAVKNVTLYKGSFPARFGGHLSSVVDVRLNDGNNQKIKGSVSVGDISSKICLEGPVGKDGNTTFNISARRTYLDLIVRAALLYASLKELDDSRLNGGYDFYDLNTKVTHRFRGGDRLSVSFYTGDDDADAMMKETFAGGRTDFKFGLKWGNLVTSAKWNHEINPQLYMNSTLSYTQYRSKMSIGLEADEEFVNASAGIAYKSIINDVCADVDFEWKPLPSHDIKFGTSQILHKFNPGILSVRESISGGDGEDVDFRQEIGNGALSAYETALFFEDNYTITSWLKANAGLRGSLYCIKGKTYFSLEPRLSARALFTNDFSFKASYSEMSQYIHLLCNSNISLPSDLWVPVTKDIKPMRSRQAAAGFFLDKGRYELSAEGYWKTMDNVLEYKDGASYMNASTGWEEKVCMGKGWSYGLELLIQKKTGDLTGWIGYTLSKSMRQFDREGNIINDGIPFPAKYDRRHDFSATLAYKFLDNCDISATYIYESGNCGSLAYDLFPASLPGEDYAPMTGYLPYRNNYRMPDYSRLDLGINFYKQKKHGQRVWNISIYNVLNTLNPYLIMVTTEYGKPVLQKMSIFPIIPSISYTYNF